MIPHPVTEKMKAIYQENEICGQFIIDLFLTMNLSYKDPESQASNQMWIWLINLNLTSGMSLRRRHPDRLQSQGNNLVL